MSIYLRCSKTWRAWKARRRRKALLASFAKIPAFQGERLDRLITLVGSKDFLLFLEYLGLTVNDKLTILSNIDLLDEVQQKRAIRLQLQMQGLMQAYDIADYLASMAKPKEEDKNELE